MNSPHHWPDLPYELWRDTYATLHRWLQIIGKVRVAKAPWINHAWHSALHLTARGLSTPLTHEPEFAFSLEMDFIEHALQLRRSDGRMISVPLRSESVASFHSRCSLAFSSLGMELNIHDAPNELSDATPFSKDETHCTYDPEFAHRAWQVLLQCDRVMQRFRSEFIGKVSPVHFFWGSFDLAVTRFSGRRAPEHPGGIPHLPDRLTRESYSHEVSSCGFWPGNELVPFPAFYSYAYPSPEGFANADVQPSEAFYHEQLREFILPYDTVRLSSDPDQTLLEFFRSTYAAAADLGRWDRKTLEESPYLAQLQEEVARREQVLEKKRAA